MNSSERLKLTRWNRRAIANGASEARVFAFPSWAGIVPARKAQLSLLSCSRFAATAFAIAALMDGRPLSASGTAAVSEKTRDASPYRRFEVEEQDSRIVATTPRPEPTPPRWAREVSQRVHAWHMDSEPDKPRFIPPIPFVVPPTDPAEPFHPHNHQPSITWLPNGDLLAIWFSTVSERGPELTVLASRFRAGQSHWDPASEFFKAPNRNMTGSSLFHDGKGTVYHFNGVGREGAGHRDLALLLRTSADNGATWTPPRAIRPQLGKRHQVIAGTVLTSTGSLIQCCDDAELRGSAPQVSIDGGMTWIDPGAGKPAPQFVAGGLGEGTIAGIHAAVAELNDGRLMALGREHPIDGRMPLSLSADGGRTWTYHASAFPPIGGGQRAVLLRLREGPLLCVSFTSGQRKKPEANGMAFPAAEGGTFVGHGMFAAVSFDEGASWPVRKLLTPGKGNYDGGGHTGAFTATPARAEHAGYLAATQSPDGMIHLLSSRLHYRFNLAWLRTLPGVKP